MPWNWEPTHTTAYCSLRLTKVLTQGAKACTNYAQKTLTLPGHWATATHTCGEHPKEELQLVLVLNDTLPL